MHTLLTVVYYDLYLFLCIILSIGSDYRKFEKRRKYYNTIDGKTIPEGCTSKDDVYDHIAKSIAAFVNEYEMDKGVKYKCAFIFGFPVEQSNIFSGKLVRWTKGFHISGDAKHDPKKMLENAITERGEVKIDIVAFLNNSTALLYGGVWKNVKCKIGLILEEGINASYVENINKVSILPRACKATLDCRKYEYTFDRYA